MTLLAGGSVPIPSGMARSTIDLPVDDRAALDAARAEDGVDLTSRLRAMVRLYLQDEKVRAQVHELVVEERRERYARPSGVQDQAPR